MGKKERIRLLLICAFGLFFITTFFFSIIPLKLEGLYSTPEHYVYGGYAFTSVLYQLSVGNYVALLSFLVYGYFLYLIFIFTGGNNKK